MRVVDVRSDTVTLPSQEMRAAMLTAEVGDDVYGEDPTVRALEERAAELTGKEAGLFVASGTMGNAVALLTHSRRGNEIICEAEAHVFYYEAAGAACLGGVQLRPLAGVRGLLDPAIIAPAIRAENIHHPRTALICLENTHNRAGGTYYALEQLAAIRRLADDQRLPVHIDGARICNAAVALGVPIRHIAQYADSVMFCLSKGLSAPVGSLLVGARAFIDEALRYRKMLGGGMRQAGFLAAAGLVALDTMVERLAEDHTHARLLAEYLADVGLPIDPATVCTNIVVFDTRVTNLTAEQFTARLLTQGIKASVYGEYTVRMVTHYGITRDDIDFIRDGLRWLLEKRG